MTNVIGLFGPAGAGKSEVASILEHDGYARVRFSYPLKEMMRAFFRACGVSEPEIERRIEGDLKEVPDQLLGGKTPRYAMQMLGTEWGRVLIDDTLWSKAWAARAEVEVARGRKIVAEDLRFPDEAKEIRKLGGKAVLVTGRQKKLDGEHASEQWNKLHADARIENSSTISALADRVALLQRFFDRERCA